MMQKLFRRSMISPFTFGGGDRSHSGVYAGRWLVLDESLSLDGVVRIEFD